jgi:hypothetical protein
VSNKRAKFGSQTTGPIKYMGSYINDEYNIGDIWCVTLLEMNRNLNDIPLSLQLVGGCLLRLNIQLTPSNLICKLAFFEKLTENIY